MRTTRVTGFGPETFIVRVGDDCMEPRFRDGDFVWIDPDAPAVDGCFVGVWDGVEGETTAIRRFQKRNGQRTLCTLNPCRVECVIDAKNETVIRGVVVFVGSGV